MGNRITRQTEKWGKAYLAESMSNKAVSPEADFQRLESNYWGHFFLRSRANYLDYQATKSDLKSSWKGEGLYGKDLAGFGIASVYFFLAFTAGQAIGRESLNSFRLSDPFHKYAPVGVPDHHDLPDSKIPIETRIKAGIKRQVLSTDKSLPEGAKVDEHTFTYEKK